MQYVVCETEQRTLIQDCLFNGVYDTVHDGGLDSATGGGAGGSAFGGGSLYGSLK